MKKFCLAILWLAALAMAQATPAAPAALAADGGATTPIAKFQVRPADDAWQAALPHDAQSATQAYLDRLPPT